MKISEIRTQFPQYEDISDRELVNGLHKAHYADMPYADFLKSIDFSERIDPTKEMGLGEKFSAGFGKAMYDIGQGAGQMVGLGESGEETKNRRELDAPLMQTGGGIAGNLAGNITSMMPLVMVPGAGTVAGAGALGMTAAAMQPAEGVGERAKNMAVGFGLGAGTQALAGPVARKAGEMAADREAKILALKSQNSVRDQTLREGQALGLTTPPSSVNPSITNDVLESIAGKAAVNQQASKMNNPIVDEVGRREASLAPNQAISTQSLKDARKIVAAPFRELSAISPQAKADLDALKEARLESKLGWQHFAKSGEPASYKAATQADALADSLETALEQHAAGAGRTDLVESMRKARVLLAKNHTVDRALNVGTGSLDPAVFGTMLDRGAPLSGDIKKIAAFQQAFKPAMREASNVPNPGSSKLASVLSGGMGAGGFMAAGPAGLAAAAVPFAAPPAARSLQLARGRTIQPDYAVSALTKGASSLRDPEVQRRLSVLARALAMPATPALTD